MLYSKASPLPINKVLTFICQCLKDYTIFFRLLADALEVTEDGAAGSDLVPGPRVCFRFRSSLRYAFNDVNLARRGSLVRITGLKSAAELNGPSLAPERHHGTTRLAMG